eukprot:CAMPEP_0118708834 /NCGR_PEP_ID=MMETSP0800-20121206/22192_1 /TAXON_ID=210618 ORGANISM="Striatella unipunctata, Strain CCMP2910" /NCGR_SAMPLE_ID=MMETSP0800 /ASSEMBLY_ACC=CAM_ASM_000638 /LENGTH=107 /DNA_ID=CAMNT_0006612241 /DNA_START=112 /DNA_END=435 /DNA_ORIENTATION=+
MTMVRLVDSNPLCAKLLCTRGFEGMTKKGSKTRSRHRRYVKTAVFKAQKQQRSFGIFANEESIGLVSESESLSSRIDAAKLAFADFEEVKKIYLSDRKLVELLRQVN